MATYTEKNTRSLNPIYPQSNEIVNRLLGRRRTQERLKIGQTLSFQECRILTRNAGEFNQIILGQSTTAPLKSRQSH